MNKLVLHIPHSSIEIPLLDGYISNQKKINQEIIKLTDWYTDELFDSEVDNKIVTPFSRIFCDVERFADDELEIMAKVGMGVLYEKFDNGDLLRIVAPELKKVVLKDYYWKHHNKLTQAVKEHLEQFNSCLILDCHSFPSSPLTRALVQTPKHPILILEQILFITPKHLIEASKEFFESKGYSLGVDTPYTGSIVPMEYYHKDHRVNSIMLEVNRRMYLNEPTNEKSDGYNKTKEVVRDYLYLLRFL